MTFYQLSPEADIDTIVDAMPPLWRNCLATLVERGSTRTNDGGMVDDILSSCASRPSVERPLARWSVNPNSRADGFISLYVPTDLGREVTARFAARPFKVGIPTSE